MASNIDDEIENFAVVVMTASSQLVDKIRKRRLRVLPGPMRVIGRIGVSGDIAAQPLPIGAWDFSPSLSVAMRGGLSVRGDPGDNAPIGT